MASLEKAAALGAERFAASSISWAAPTSTSRPTTRPWPRWTEGLAGKPNLATDALALEATSTLGAVYFAQGKIAEAEAQFQRVLAAKPGAAGATLGMAKIHFSKGEVEKALALFEKVVADHPGTPEATQAATFIKELRKSPFEGAPQ